MATELTTLTPNNLVFPWTFPRQGRRELVTPRAEIRNVIDGSSIAATGVGDNQMWTIVVNLPENYAYTLLDYSVSIRGDTATANNWGQVQNVKLQNGNTDATSDYEYRLQAYNDGPEINGTELKYMRTFWLRSQPEMILVSTTNNVKLRSSQYNTTANDQAYTIYCLVRWLQYDLSDAYHSDVNTPILTR